MKGLTVLKTSFSRVLILILSFGLVIYSTNMWGSEGKGIISILIANSTIVEFFSYILAGSSTSYFAARYEPEKVLPFAYVWAILMGLGIPFIFYLADLQPEYIFYLIGISIINALLAANINLYVGRQNIKLFNIISVLKPLLHIIFIFGFTLIENPKDVKIYFLAQMVSYGLLFLLSLYQILKKTDYRKFRFSKLVFRDMFEYGWKTQLSAFVQFLNYRLSFYFLEHFHGLALVGIFSVGIALSEAIWSITRSIAVILYSEVLNSESRKASILKTKSALRLSFWFTFIFLGSVLIVPAELFAWIFGRDFGDTKIIMIFLSLGILAIAVSDMIGYYFSAIRELRILNIKSFVGLFVTIVLSFLLIPNLGIKGACIVTTVSYVVSAVILFGKFYQSTSFSLNDYLFSKKDIERMKKKLIRK